MYADVDVIVDGALDETQRFHDEGLMSSYLMELEAEAEGHGYPTEVYVMFHDHDDSECECVQYETDGRPKYIFNVYGETGVWQ